jgi:hypothetical protein
MPLLEPGERDAVTRAGDDIRALSKAADDVITRCVNAPASTSAVATSRGRKPDEYWLTTAYSSVLVATDHLRALRAAWAAEQGMPHSAGYTLIRGAAEAAARACWLADCSISSRQRIARGILEWDYSMDRIRRADEDGEHARRIRAGFDTTIVDVGYPLLGRRVEGRICDGERRPKITDLMKAQLPVGGLAYALLSGYAHAEVWVMMLDWEPAGPNGVVVALNITRQLNLLRVAALFLLKEAVGSLVELAALDVSAWERRALPLVFGR